MSTKQQSLSDALITARKAIAVLAEPEAKIAETAATLKTARQEHAERIAVAASAVGSVVGLMTAASSTGKIKRIDVVRAIHPDFPNAERWTEIKKTASDKRTDEERAFVATEQRIARLMKLSENGGSQAKAGSVSKSVPAAAVYQIMRTLFAYRPDLEAPVYARIKTLIKATAKGDDQLVANRIKAIKGAVANKKVTTIAAPARKNTAVAKAA